jgi:hypothetical protein
MSALKFGPIAILMIAAPLGCASPSPGERDGAEGIATLDWEEVLPPRSSETEADAHLRRGVRSLDLGELDAASREFNRALQFDPASSYHQFFNALAYHPGGEGRTRAGDPRPAGLRARAEVR